MAKRDEFLELALKAGAILATSTTSMMAVSMDGWIGVDLDGTLAMRVPGRYSPYAIGAPIPRMVQRVCDWIDAGRDVRVFTARACDGDPMVDVAVRAWCLRHIGCELQVTAVKDHLMVELWDDRAVRVEADTGRVLSVVTDASTAHLCGTCKGLGVDMATYCPHGKLEGFLCPHCG